MSVVSRYNSKQLYFPEALLARLNTIPSENLTIVEAPLGYGKTTAIRHFFEESDLKYVWINADSRDKYRFFDEFCTGIRYFDEEISARLKAAGYPSDEEMCNKDIAILMDIELKEKSFIIVDNYHNVADGMISRFLYETASVHKLKLNIVLITQSLGEQFLREKVYNNEVNYISKSDFEFTEDEIIIYYRKCGIKLSSEEAGYLQKYADGWISAIYLQMLYYIENGSFESNIGINRLISEMFWERLDINSQDLLIKLGLFESFTLRQAVMMADGIMDERNIKHLLSSNRLIYYDNVQRKYYIHGIMRYFLSSELDKLEPVFKKGIYEKTGEWYAGNKEYFKAIKVFYEIGDYESIYKMEFLAGDIDEYISNGNKDMFMDIIRNTSSEVKEKNISGAIVMCFLLFIYNEKDFFKSEINELERIIENKTFKTERSYNIIRGKLQLLYAMDSFNNLDEMKKHYEAAWEYMKAPCDLMSQSLSWTFKTPSVFANLYRGTSPASRQLEEFEKIIPYYYKLTGGQGKGAEALMRAEMLLYSMDFESAEILCHKALYMAETRNQLNIYISAMFCMARISIYRGDYDNIKFITRSINKKLEETKEYSENVVVDMAQSYIKILMGKVFDISGWLKDNISIEKKCLVLNMGFANIIYGRYLIENGEFVKFAGISGQMLGIAGIHDNVIYKIYTYIYIAVADYQLGEEEKSLKFISEAIGLAQDGSIYLPFIENINMLAPVLENGVFSRDDFVKNIFKYDELYGMRFKVVSRNSYGLTRREEEIARLACERYTNKEIALRLHISENTVKSNLKVVFSKLDIKSRSELNKFF